MKPKEVDIKLKLKLERYEELCRYFLTTTATIKGRSEPLQLRIMLDDRVIKDGFNGDKEKAISVMQKEAILSITKQILEELKKKDPTFILA